MTGHAPTDRGAVTPDELAGLLAAFNDVTSKLHASHEALRAEAARLTRELQDANAQVERSRRLAALGEMAAGIAHEVRNPLGSIRLYARMLQEDLSDRPRERALAAKVAHAVGVVDAIVTDVLSFAREFRLRPEVIEPPDLFDRVLELCDGADPRRGTCVERADRREGALPRVVADPALLQQALVNLVRNALDAMAEVPEGSRVLTLDCRERRLAGADGRVRPHAVLGVGDTGPGIPPEVVARMFNPFFTTRSTGTGLGLAIVHRIVDAHGGRILVRDRRGDGGTTGAFVEIALPIGNPAGGHPDNESSPGLPITERETATAQEAR
jgi:two-component system sensor histidine kinase HydH